MEERHKFLEEKLVEWMKSQGYPLEMAVARAFQRKNFLIIRSEYYLDPDTHTARETDVVASVQEEVGDVFIRLSFVLECKTSLDKPWLLFSDEMGLADPARVAQRAASTTGASFLYSLATDHRVSELPLFQIDSPASYGFTQAFTSGQDRAYEAALSAAKAVAALTHHADLQEERTGEPYALVAFPVIVLRGGLFTARLCDGERLEVKAINEGTLLWRNPVVKNPHTIIKIVTEQHLDAYVEQICASAEPFFERVTKLIAKTGSRPRKRRHTGRAPRTRKAR
ncbi:hypothetical protein WME99_00525 [Sorangium sp. So ce136]|uniref:hypothetical protein n=1 Tax=Sorangium sp. So ce136 TaxID=3133284 RepID=UPI003F0B29A6